MKIKILFSMSLSLSLLACQISAPLIAPTPEAGSQLKAFEIPAKSTLQAGFSAQVQSSAKYDQITIQWADSQAFRTQLADPSKLAFVKVSLTGEGISVPIRQDGAEFLPVTSNLSATLSGISNVDGKLRLIQVQGYDSAKQPLSTFKASAWYRSQAGVSTRSLTLNRSQNLLVDVLKNLLLNRPTVLTSIDVTALQNTLAQLLGYQTQTGEFKNDPALYDVNAIANLITSDTLPTALDLAELRVSLRDVTFQFNTSTGTVLSEKVTFVINDPISRPTVVARGTASGDAAGVGRVPIGQWILTAYGNNGNALVSTPVEVTQDGFSITGGVLTLPLKADEFRVSSSISSSLTQPAIASDSVGNSVIVWKNDNTGGIYARQFNAAGKALVSDFRIDQNGGSADDPAIAMSSNGEFVISWTERSGSSQIYARHFNTLDDPKGDAFVVSTPAGNIAQSDSAVAMDSEGDYIVAWSSYNTNTYTDYNVYARRFSDVDDPVASEFNVNMSTATSQKNPAVAMDSNGDFVIAWEDYSTGFDKTDIQAQSFSSNGVATSTLLAINNTTLGHQLDPAVAMDADGDFVVTWSDDYGIFARRYALNGDTNDIAEFAVNSDTGQRLDPAIAMSSAGNFVVTWSGQDNLDGENSLSVYARRFDTAGDPVGTDFLVPTSTDKTQNNPSVAIANDGQFTIAWRGAFLEDGSFNKNLIFAKRYTADGQVK